MHKKKVKGDMLDLRFKGNLKIVLSKSEFSVLRQLIPVLKVGQITSLHANLS